MIITLIFIGIIVIGIILLAIGNNKKWKISWGIRDNLSFIGVALIILGIVACMFAGAFIISNVTTYDLNYQNVLHEKEMLEYRIEHMEDNIMDFEEFIEVINGWNLGNKTRKEWYEEYKKLYFNQPGKVVEIKEEIRELKNGFKTKQGMDIRFRDK